MNRLEGVFPAIITPFSPTGELNEAAFRDVMEFNIQMGAHGFWIAGGTGESVLLDDEENQRLATAAVDQARGRVTNIMHVGAPTTARAARMAEHAARAGVDAVCCVPPFFYDVSDEAIVDHYRTVADATELPLLVYNLPQFTGVEITPVLIRKIQQAVPRLAGLKHSGPALGDVRDFARMGLACFIGNSYLMLPALTIGAIGCIDGPLNVAPELWVAIWNAYRAGDLTRAAAAQDQASTVTESILEFGFPASVKAALGARLNIECGDPRPPQRALTPEQKATLHERLQTLLPTERPISTTAQ